MTSYNVKIDRRVTPDGIESWITWVGNELAAVAEYVSPENSKKFTKFVYTRDVSAPLHHMQTEHRRFFSVETFARFEAERAVRELIREMSEGGQDGH